MTATNYPIWCSWQPLTTFHDGYWSFFLTLSWQLLNTSPPPTPMTTITTLMTTTGHPLTLSWQLLTTLMTATGHTPHTFMTTTGHTPHTLMTTTGHPPPPWHLQQLQTTPLDTHNKLWSPLLTLMTTTDHSFWHFGQLLTPPPLSPDTHNSYRPLLLTLMTITDHPWHSWQLATFSDIHDNNWPSLILMTITDHLSWHSRQFQTTPPDTHANYWPLFMTLYSEPWKIAGTVSIISCKLTLAVGDSCLCCCVHCYMAVCWVQLMGVVYWVLLIPFVSEFLLA